MDTKLGKVMNAVKDAQQHLSTTGDYEHLECVYVDRMLAKVVDLPTDSKQKNIRRNLQIIRDWMIADGPGVVLLEILGQLYWRLGDLNSKEFETVKESLHQQPSYLTLVRDPKSAALVMQRLKYVQEAKFNAFDLFRQELDNSLASSPESLRLTPSPRSRSMTRCSSMSEDSLEPCMPPEVTDIRKNKTESIFGCLDAPISPYRGAIGTWNLPKSELEQVLIDFYINWLCPRQTLMHNSNAYFKLLNVAERSPSTLFAVLSLSASYIKDCLLYDNERYHQADYFYALKAVQALGAKLRDQESTEACLATGMLLVHHDIVNESPQTEVCWTCHTSMLDVLPDPVLSYDSDPALYMHYQLILARTAQPVNQMHFSTGALKSTTKPLADRALDHVDDNDDDDAWRRVCGVLGLSRQLLSIIESTTALVVNGPFTRREYKMSRATRLDHELATLTQWTPDDVVGPALEVVTTTAETYRIAAQIYLQCRFFGLTRCNPTISNLTARLSHLILSLPHAGPLSTALYPTWPLFVAAVATRAADVREALCRRVWEMTVCEKSNLGSVLEHLSNLWDGWIGREGDGEQRRRQGWWEDMLESVRPRATLLSLG